MLAELATAVRSGSLAPIDLVEEALARIEAHDPAIGAVVALHAEEARAEAEGHPRTGALAGLPLLVKDMARCRGSRTTMGSRLYADAPPDEVDDIAVARLRAAGAIVIGRSNSPEFGHAPFTANSLFGATVNPWNPDLSPGGSSGGSAAALAAGMVPLATTSDGGGSVRIPAALCGLVGLKPTMGAIGRNVLPRWIEFSTQGVSGHSVADVLHQARVLYGPAPGDWVSAPSGAVALEPARPARVLACRTFRADVDPAVEAAYEESLDLLVDAGLAVERVESPSGPAAAMDWFLMSAAELAQSLSEVRQRWGELDPTALDLVRFGEAVTTADYIAADRRRHDLGARIDHLLGTDAVLVLPTLNVTGWGPRGPMPDAAGSVSGDPTIGANTPELNATGHPAVSVPMGLGPSGVPMGLQVVAPRHRDGLALGAARVLEELRPWPAVAPGHTPFGSAFDL